MLAAAAEKLMVVAAAEVVAVDCVHCPCNTRVGAGVRARCLVKACGQNGGAISPPNQTNR